MKVHLGRTIKTLGLGLVFIAAQSFAAEPEAVPGEYVVKLKDDFLLAQTNLHSLSSGLGEYVKSTIPGQNIVVVKRPVFETETSAVKSLASNPYIEYAEPNYIYRINKTPNDPMYTQLWGMKNIGQKDSKGQVGVPGMDIGAEQAWDIETGSKKVLVAVIDTGVDYNNLNLKDNIWTNEAELNGKAGVDDDGNGYIDDIHGYNFNKNSGDPLDDHGHGSHCAGTIGAKGNDGDGIVGVNWDVQIMGVKFLDANGSGTLEGALKSIDYATKNGAKIMSNSWGGGGFSQTLKDAIQRSHEAGALFVAAAGNESNNNDSKPTYPATYDIPNVLSVAAVDNRGQIASFSNYGKTKVHVGAPGVNIVSTTTKGYESWSGTSMATPHVSGIAALLAAHDSVLTNVQLKERIMATAKPVATLKNKVKTAGIANAYLALTNTQSPPDQNDPANWQTMNMAVASDHPYKNKAKDTYSVSVPGAKEFALYFSKFQTERSYDVLTIKDAKGNVIEKISGNNDDSFSAVIPGDTATLEFTSDDSVNYFGFEITKAAWR